MRLQTGSMALFLNAQLSHAFSGIGGSAFVQIVVKLPEYHR